MPRGIARKLVIYLTLIIILVEGLFAFTEIRAQRRQLLHEMTLSAELASETMVATTWNAMLEDRREYAYQMMENVARQPTIDEVRMFNKAGRVTFSAAVKGEMEKESVGAPFAPLGELVGKFTANGGKILVCSPCLKKRGITEDMLVEGATAAGGAALVEWLSQDSPCVGY